MFPLLKSMGVLILGVLICVDFFEIFWYFWWDFVGNHGKLEDEPGEGREEPTYGRERTIKKLNRCYYNFQI
jgi:hypothetical protein